MKDSGENELDRAAFRADNEIDVAGVAIEAFTYLAVYQESKADCCHSEG